MAPAMTVTVRSFAKINLGLCIGARRADGFHDLRTVYQTIALHDLIRVEVVRGHGDRDSFVRTRVFRGIETNTCYRIAELAMARSQGARAGHHLDRQAVAGAGRVGCGFGECRGRAAWRWKRALKKKLPGSGEVADCGLGRLGSAFVPESVGRCWVWGGGKKFIRCRICLLSVCVVATPEIGVSTPEAFRGLGCDD